MDPNTKFPIALAIGPGRIRVALLFEALLRPLVPEMPVMPVMPVMVVPRIVGEIMGDVLFVAELVDPPI